MKEPQKIADNENYLLDIVISEEEIEISVAKKIILKFIELIKVLDAKVIKKSFVSKGNLIRFIVDKNILQIDNLFKCSTVKEMDEIFSLYPLLLSKYTSVLKLLKDNQIRIKLCFYYPQRDASRIVLGLNEVTFKYLLLQHRLNKELETVELKGELLGLNVTNRSFVFWDYISDAKIKGKIDRSVSLDHVYELPGKYIVVLDVISKKDKNGVLVNKKYVLKFLSKTMISYFESGAIVTL